MLKHLFLQCRKFTIWLRSMLLFLAEIEQEKKLFTFKITIIVHILGKEFIKWNSKYHISCQFRDINQLHL